MITVHVAQYSARVLVTFKFEIRNEWTDNTKTGGADERSVLQTNFNHVLNDFLATGVPAPLSFVLDGTI